MDKLSPAVTVAVTFKDADGNIVTAPEGVSFASSTPGVDAFTFDATTQNADGPYNLLVGPASVGTDTITATGLTGSLAVSVTAPAAVSVEFTPSSI